MKLNLTKDDLTHNRWRILDQWVWHTNDIPSASLSAWLKEKRQEYPSAKVGTFKRNVKAGGATIPVMAGVVREERERVYRVTGRESEDYMESTRVDEIYSERDEAEARLKGLFFGHIREDYIR